jgi:putative addiction module component (TIGR02574 family)
MTKLQSIVAEIEALPAEEQRELVSMFAHLAPAKQDIFELTDEELAELDKRLATLDSEPTFTPDEVFSTLREKYVQGDLA